MQRSITRRLTDTLSTYMRRTDFGRLMTVMNNKLRTWRTEQRLTLEEVTDLTGISASMWSRVERGERQLSPQMKVLVARRLGVRVRELFPLEEEPHDEKDSDQGAS